MDNPTSKKREPRAGQTPGGASGGGGGPDGPRAQTLEQKRAKLAWKWAEEAGKNLGSWRSPGGERYANLARKLPSYLKTSGLGQTMAFLFSKSKGSDKGSEGLLFRQMMERLVPGAKNLSMDGIVDLSAVRYREATREALAMAEWLRRFVGVGEEP